MKLDVTLPEFCGALWSEAAPHLISVPLSLKRISIGSQWGAGALLHNYAGSGIVMAQLGHEQGPQGRDRKLKAQEGLQGLRRKQ